MILILDCQFCTATGAQLSSKEVLQQLRKVLFYIDFSHPAQLVLVQSRGKENAWMALPEREETFLEPAGAYYVMISVSDSSASFG